ncbi:MAG: DUF429 domain-containing protein [Anaerolineales bacterium]
MLFTNGIFVGIDPTAGKRPMQYVALDRNLKLVAMDRGELESILAFVGSLETAVVAIDAPQSPNRGLMGQPDVRRRFNLQQGGRTWRQWRVSEYELRRRNIRVYNTPSDEESAHAWVRTGIEIFRRLRLMGFREFRADDKTRPRVMVEARSHAGFTVLLEHRPFLKQTLEGRMQRQLQLYLEGLDIPNPMHSLEEITRHHLLTGNLPLENLYDHEQLDAMMAAYTGYMAAMKPEEVIQVGDPEEGCITLPTGDLQDFYP